MGVIKSDAIPINYLVERFSVGGALAAIIKKSGQFLFAAKAPHINYNISFNCTLGLFGNGGVGCCTDIIHFFFILEEASWL
jgi:hypothetical protein